MQRREFFQIAVSLPLAFLLTGAKQGPDGLPIVGVLWHAAGPDEERPMYDWVREGFAQAGLQPGKRVIIEDRYPAEAPDRFVQLAADLVNTGCDILVGVGPAASAALKSTTSTIPTVIIMADPVGMGFADALARPGGNITGISLYTFELDSKRLQLFKEALPSMSRIALLANPEQRFFLEKNLQNYTAAAKELGVNLTLVEVRNGSELRAAFQTISRDRFEGIILGRTGLFDGGLKTEIANLALAAKLPIMGDQPAYPEAGILMSYSADWKEAFMLIGESVRRILSGEKPSEIPVQIPRHFELVINTTTANALGLQFTPGFLSRVDRTIE